MTALPHLIDVWRAPDDLIAYLPRLAEISVARCDKDIDPDELDIAGVRNSDTAPYLPILYCYAASSHVDLFHKPWIAIFVVTASAGHDVVVVDYKPTKPAEADNYPDDTPRSRIPVRAGDIILMNDHHTHWLTPADDNTMFIAVNFDLDERESRDDVVARFRTAIEAQGIIPAIAASGSNHGQ